MALARIFRPIIARARDESGVAMVVAAGVLMVVGILSAVVATASMNQRSQSTEDRASKRALAAAEAGVRRAIYRLNKVEPGTDQCVTDSGTAITPSGTIWCKGHGYVGGGAAYDFFVSQVLTGAAGRESVNGCVGSDQTIATFSTTLTIDQRCIVAVGCVQPANTSRTDPCVSSAGVMRGVHRRVQVRTGAKAETQYFPAGLYGNERLCISQTNWTSSGCSLTGSGSSRVDSDVGSNTLLGLSRSGSGNAVPVCNAATGPGTPKRAQVLIAETGSLTSDSDTGGGDGIPLSDNRCNLPGNTLIPQIVPVPTFGSSPDVERPFRGCFLDPQVQACNFPTTSDTALPANNLNDEYMALPTRPACVLYHGDRELDLRACPGGTTVTLPPGNYNFCRVWIDQQILRPAAAATPPPSATRKDPFTGNPVRIFLDSPYRQGSGCGVGNNLAGTTTPGTSPTLSTSTWNQTSNCSGQNQPSTFRCADGSFEMSNNSTISGAIVNQSMRFQIWAYGNPNNTYPPPASNNTCRPGGTAQASLPCPPPLPVIDFRNGTDITFVIYAPNSGVQVQNSAGGSSAITLGGSIRARDIILGNNIVYSQDPNTRDVSRRDERRRYFRGPWLECRPNITSAADPRSGC